MALEKWLMAYAEAWPNDIDNLLVDVLRRSRNAAITAVVASVATAVARVVPETVLALLSSRECILLDRVRLAAEGQTGALAGIFPFRDAEQRVYEAERKESNALPHRKHDLETAVANVQLGEHCARVEQLIDRHRKDVPPQEEQTEDDRVWRLALHRMDLRQYTVASPPQQETDLQPAMTGAVETSRQMIRLDLRHADPDVEQMVDATARQVGDFNNRLSLLMWGMRVFSREDTANFDPAHWRRYLAEARQLPDDTDEETRLDPSQGGAAYVACVCIRDHFEEMSTDEVGWCIETVCDAVERSADNWDGTARVQHYSMGADRPSAWILSALTAKTLGEKLRVRVREAFAAAVLHPVDEVRAYATWGIGQNLWASDRLLAIHCVHVLASEAKSIHGRWRSESKKPFNRRRDYGQIEQAVGTAARKNFYAVVDEGAYDALDLGNWTCAKANGGILRILSPAVTERLAVDAFRRVSDVLVSWWDSDDEHRGNRRRERSFDAEASLSSMLEQFVLNVTPAESEIILQPLLNVMERHPEKVASILQGIIGFEDRICAPDRFWHIWELFAVGARHASWLKHIDSEHPMGGPVMAAVFLTTYWKDDVRHWRSLEGHAFHVHRLFEELPTSANILDSYVRFLYHIGEQSLPQAFRRVSVRLRAGDPPKMLRKSNTVFMLETLLRRYVYGRPMELKKDRELREAVLYLLDALVENGSSAAYRMRDDFVTPVT
jgi:hypothetical protein